MRRDFARILILCAVLSGTSPAIGAVINLTGAVSEGTSSTGDYTSLYDWHTASLPSGAYQLWVIQGSNINGAFINGPDQSQSGINVPLAIGANTFTIYADHRFSDVGYYGLSLAFNGVNVPVISGYAAAQTSMTSTPPLAAIPTTSLIRWDDSIIPSSGKLSYQVGDELVTLTSFQYATIGVYNADRVGPYQVGSNGILDNVGQFTLTVSVVPEPPSSLLLASGAGSVMLTLLRYRSLLRR